MKIHVLKFGGTSVANESARASAIEHIRSFLDQGWNTVVIVSAMGRNGAPYATDTLLSLLDGENSSPRTRDLIMSCGETISSCVFADALEKAGIKAMPMNALSAGIRGEQVYNSADITGMDCSNVYEALKNGYVPIITGFQAVAPNGDTVTLGRGGSDISAVEVGGCLNADDVIIYTDVPGIAKADPRAVPNAPFIGRIAADDMLVLAEAGAGVVHPRAVKALMKFGIPVWVRSTFDFGDGTLIADGAADHGLIGIASKKNGDSAAITAVYHPFTDALVSEAGHAIAALTSEHNGDTAVFTVQGERKIDAVNTLYDLLTQND